jgi:hypothetical protein
MLTIKELQKLTPGKWASDAAARGSGALWFRKSEDSKRVSVYFGYTHEGKKRKLPMGTYDEQGVSGFTLAQCREKYGGISRVYQSGITDLHAHFERERETTERTPEAEAEAARRAAEEAERGALRQLLAARVSYLKRKGSTDTAKDEESMFRRHVPEELKDRKATELGTPDFKPVIAKLVEAGHGRGAAKLRTALRAAYQLAVDSGTDPDVPEEFGTFGITFNPVASVSARSLAKYNQARERTLSAPELTALLKRMDALDQVPQREALKVCLYLGGQRPTQLLRAQVTDIDIDAGSNTLSALIKEISDNMVKESDARAPFQLRDIRRTAETILASLKVSKDVRSHLLSHGLGGVQNQHYDRHTYWSEKRQALKKWAAYLAKLKEGKTADSVLPAKPTETRA